MGTPASLIDEVLASHLELTMFQYMVTIKHTLPLNRHLRGFIFAYCIDGIVHYDQVPLIDECNGLRIRHPKFAMPSAVRKRIAKHQYHRWFMYSDDILYPLQIAKPSTLEDAYLFKVNDDVRYRTQTAYTEDTMFLRKKPLLAMRPFKPGWSVTLRHASPLLQTA